MEDYEIVALYWDRNEEAIAQTQQRYGGYLYKIAFQVLANGRRLRRQSAPPGAPCGSGSYTGKS